MGRLIIRSDCPGGRARDGYGTDALYLIKFRREADGRGRDPEPGTGRDRQLLRQVDRQRGFGVGGGEGGHDFRPGQT